jgi:predicted NAD/FAD-dependent oxidoreductase
MRDPTTGAFIPQDPDYLQSADGPAKQMLAAFEACLGFALPSATFLTAQRWGSAMPAPANYAGGTVDVCGDTYATAHTLDLVLPEEGAGGGAGGGEESGDDFVDGGDLNMHFAGDFCSTKPPGVEAAALSGYHAAERIVQRKRKQNM